MLLCSVLQIQDNFCRNQIKNKFLIISVIHSKVGFSIYFLDISRKQPHKEPSFSTNSVVFPQTLLFSQNQCKLQWRRILIFQTMNYVRLNNLSLRCQVENIKRLEYLSLWQKSIPIFQRWIKIDICCKNVLENAKTQIQISFNLS